MPLVRYGVLAGRVVDRLDVRGASERLLRDAELLALEPLSFGSVE